MRVIYLGAGPRKYPQGGGPMKLEKRESQLGHNAEQVALLPVGK